MSHDIFLPETTNLILQFFNDVSNEVNGLPFISSAGMNGFEQDSVTDPEPRSLETPRHSETTTIPVSESSPSTLIETCFFVGDGVINYLLESPGFSREIFHYLAT